MEYPKNTNLSRYSAELEKYIKDAAVTIHELKDNIRQAQRELSVLKKLGDTECKPEKKNQQ